nr:cytochrome f [Cavernulicola chilensis]
MNNNNKSKLHAIRYNLILFLVLIGIFISPSITYSYPIYAQQAYDNPREATGRIVCANCHLVQRPVHIEAPKSILPDSVFETKVTIPYNTKNKQILSNGSKGPMNVGAVLILPEGFKTAPKNRIPEATREKTKNLYFTQYSKNFENIVVVGPIPGDKNQEIVFPILSPDPKSNKGIHYLKYPIYAGGNRGRGQIYPTGDKSNNNLITSPVTGQIDQISPLEKGGYKITIITANAESVVQQIPTGLTVIVQEGEKVNTEQGLTADPNVGGFGQTESEIVLQSPQRIVFFILFCITMLVAQISFVLKKKQFEKVQAAEMNF